MILNRDKFIFLMKEPDSYVFSAESNHSEQLGRVVITKDVNKAMRQVSNQLPGKPNITSHSFKIGFITQSWKDSKDIEFVKQSIGHQKLDTTSAYVNQLSDQERQNRIDYSEAKIKPENENKLSNFRKTERYEKKKISFIFILLRP